MRTEDFIKEAKEKHNGKYIYNIQNNTVLKSDKVETICPIHGIFYCNVFEHLKNRRGCPKCASIERGLKQRKTIEKFKQQAIKVHGDKYDYSQSEYETNDKNIKIICHKKDIYGNEHGIFTQTPNSHLNGRGCPKCAQEKRGDIAYGFCRKRFSQDDFLQRAREIHGDKYDYSESIYKNNCTKLTIICPIHGKFEQTPNKHINGKQGCPKCRYERNADKCRLTTNDFKQRAIEIHGDKYDYSRVIYKGYEVPVTIGCPIHGWFETTPDSHLHSGGCGKCGVTLSKKEDEIVKFLQKLLGEREVKTRVRGIIGQKELDIYIPEKHLAIEYNGILWHSEKYGKDCNYHLDKTIKCEKQGIKLIQIFEDEYFEHKTIVLNKIKHIIGEDKNKVKIRGHKCIIKKINVNESREFLNKYHIQGFVRATTHIGAYYNDELIAVMSFSKLRKNNSEYELVRFASNYNYLCYGVAGKIFKYFIENYHPSYVKSFADRRWTLDKDNNLYVKLGFSFKTFTNPDYSYFCKQFSNTKRIHKFNFRKKNLIKKFPGYKFTQSMTENEMAKQLNAYKIWNCGLIKYEWYPSNI